MRSGVLTRLVPIFWTAVLGALAACGARDDATVLRIAHTMNQEHPVHHAMLSMADRIDELSGGEMTMMVYASGQLGSERELIELLQIGSVSMAKVTTLSLEGFSPEMAVFSTPYLFEDNDHLWRVLDGDVGRDLFEGLEPVLLKGIGYYEAGSRSFYTKDAPVRTPADLAGKKIRVLPSRAAIEMVDALGGSATPVTFAELYTGLQQGVVDGAENNPPSYYLNRHFEAAPYYSLDEHTSPPDAVLMSLRVWEGLNAQERAWLMQAMRESTALQRTLWAEAEAEALAAVEAAGGTIIRPDKQPFRDAVAPLRRKHIGTPIGALIERIEAEGSAPTRGAE